MSELEQPASPGRRKIIRTGALAGALAAIPQWAYPTLGEGEQLVSFTDMPEGFSRPPAQPGSTHFLDTRKISSFYTPNEDFYVVQHYGQPDLDPASHRLKITGMVDREKSLSLDQLKRYPQVELDVGFECGGNQPRLFHGLIGNARWRGVRLADVLRDCGIQAGGKEVVFFGADQGEEEIRGKKVKQSFGRSLSVEDAMGEDNLLAFEMNGEPLPLFHGKPLRLIVPGYYGVANVKWLSQIHVQDTRFMGRFMARDYVTLKKDKVGGEERWVESSVGVMNLKSVISRVTRLGKDCRIMGFVLNDGTPLKSVEVSIDGGPWQLARFHEANTRYSWKLFSFDWADAEAGEHTLVSRVTDIEGRIQPTVEEMPEKVTYWEDFAQFPRRIRI